MLCPGRALQEGGVRGLASELIGVLCGVGLISNAGKRGEGAVRAVDVVVVAATVLPLK